VTIVGRALQGQVDTTEGDRGERLAVDVLEHGVRDHDDCPSEDVSQREDVHFLQTLVHRWQLVLILAQVVTVQRDAAAAKGNA
jgi:hypothetical protein